MPPTAEPRCRGTHSAEGQVTWHYSGRIDGLVGTGATGAERALGYGSAAVLTLLIVGDDLLRVEPVAQAGWQVALLALFAFDIAGGAVANMLNSCKRLYHSPPRPEEGAILRALKNPRLFTALHVHPLLIVWAFGGSLAHAAIWYLLLQVAVWGVLATPLYLRRALATAVSMLAIIGAPLVLPLGAGLGWVVPALFVKLVLAHAVREEPYAAPSQLALSSR
ncbi:hypothetical protein L2D00_00145 [Hyphomonadaceae bacterium BL14]|nr:hypothetical protein L2D00_00145 [Hyphomonadaceae bacterium BL14]